MIKYLGITILFYFLCRTGQPLLEELCWWFGEKLHSQKMGW